MRPAPRPDEEGAPVGRDRADFSALARAVVDAAVEARARVVESVGEGGVESGRKRRRRKVT